MYSTVILAEIHFIYFLYLPTIRRYLQPLTLALRPGERQAACLLRISVGLSSLMTLVGVYAETCIDRGLIHFVLNVQTEQTKQITFIKISQTSTQRCGSQLSRRGIDVPDPFIVLLETNEQNNICCFLSCPGLNKYINT